MARPLDEIEEEIKKAQGWYGQRYRKEFVVRRRYDKEEKHFSWQIIAVIGGKERVMQFGISVASLEGPQFKFIKPRILDHIKQTLIKSQVKWEPGILAIY